MGDAPYRWRHENRAGVDVLPHNLPIPLRYRLMHAMVQPALETE